ncbi:MAG TPA: hypothetical protein VII49_13500 [Rhizomicrobium sp.]
MTRIIVAALLASALVPASALAAASGFDGTWKEDTNTLHMTGKPVMLVVDHGTYDCKSCVPKIKVKVDGQPHAVKGSPTEDAVAVTAPDDRTVSVTRMKDGKTVGTASWSVGPDGKHASLDFTATRPGGQQVTGKYVFRRMGAGPKGANFVSGSWMPDSMTASDNDLTTTVKVEGGDLTMSSPTGETVTAPLSGKPAELQGGTPGTTVSVTMHGDSRLMERDMRDGKVVEIVTYALAPDGKSMKVDARFPVVDHHATYTMVKQ